jgi:putative hemolysin
MSTKQEYINISKVLKSKNPRLFALLPRFVIRYIERVIHQEELNRELYEMRDLKGVDKFRKFMEFRNVSIEINGAENIPKEGRFIFASNHPHGGPDGVIFTMVVNSFFKKVKFLVNDILMNIPDVEKIFLPINKHGANNRECVQGINDAYSSDNQILIFPAGIVSRKKNGVIKDLEWQKSFIAHAKKYQRDVIPVFISGKNSNFFYNLANFRKRIGIKANLEMFYLVDELYRHNNETIKIYFGAPVSYTTFDDSKSTKEWAEVMKQKTYGLIK